MEACKSTDAQIVQRFASGDKYGAPAHDITYAAANAAIEHMATAFEGQGQRGRWSTCAGPGVLVDAQALVGGGGCFRERVRGAHACPHARGYSALTFLEVPVDHRNGRDPSDVVRLGWTKC